MHGPDHPRRRGHSRQGRGDVRQGGAAEAGRRNRAIRGGGVRLSVANCRLRAGPARQHGPHRIGGDCVPLGPELHPDQGRGDGAGGASRRARDRYGHRPGCVPVRRLPARLRRDRRGQRGVRRRPPQGHPRDRRARQLRRRAASEHPGHGRRCGLHQDLDRQGAARGHAAGGARDDGSHPRLRPRDWPSCRLQGRGRNSHLQAGDCVSRDHVRDAGRGVDDAGAPPPGRFDLAQRRADADRQGAQRRLSVRRLLHGRLMAITKKQSAELARQTFEYAPAPEAIDHVKIQPRYGLFIGGRMVEAHSKKHFPTINPATEKTLSHVVDADEVDVDRAVKAAGKAFDSWARLSPSRRSRYLFRISRLLQERSRELAVVETMDGGKPIKESLDVDIPLSAAHFFYYAGWADKLEWAFPNRKARPLRAAGQVIPWNFPLLMLAWKIAPALAAGNTVVLKPAQTTPLSAMLFAEICMQAELPPGVVNILTGAGKTGSLVVTHPAVKKVAFTGSTEVGKLIQRAIAGSGKKLTLELGGKAANIVFEDAPLDQAVEGIVNGIYFNQGHVCCAGSRLLVQESIAEPLLEKLKLRLGTLRLCDPLDKNTDIVAINPKAQLEKIQGLVESGIEEGAELYQPDCVLPDRGFWFPPSLFTNVSQSYRIAREEIFGPVLSVLTFRTPNEAVEKANNTPYGLSAGVWTDKGSRILWMAERMRAGVVWANTFNRFDPTSPFGGYKESGFGREGGVHGLLPYVDLN